MSDQKIKYVRLCSEAPPGKEFFQLECGTWVWDPSSLRGAFYAENLRKIADELDRLNNEN
jgi:hypothetical protein